MTKTSNNTLVNVATILSDCHYHNGNTLGEALQITRSAIWKTIKKLQDYGVEVDSMKGKGYALKEPLLLLSAEKIKEHLQPSIKTVEITCLETIDSTNAYLASQQASPGIHACFAEQQTAGKGRLGRAWYSPFGQNIYLSFRYPFHKDISALSGVSLVASLAVAHALKTCGVESETKWPNDILHDGKKLSGSLINVKAESNGICDAVIGIGVNVNMLEDDNHINQDWTSMRRILGDYIDRNKVAAEIINHLAIYLHKFEAQGFTPFIREWMDADCLMQKTVTIHNVGKAVTGKVNGVNEHGHLLLVLEDGTVKAFSSGDTTTKWLRPDGSSQILN